MTKIWIKPLRNLWFMNMVLHDGEVIELPEEQAQVLLKNGWAQFAEKPARKPKSSPKQPEKSDETHNQENDELLDDENQQQLEEQSSDEQPENDENQENQANGEAVQGDLTAANDHV